MTTDPGCCSSLTTPGTATPSRWWRALDRLGRSLSGVIRTIEELQRRGIVLVSLREVIDFSTPAGRLQAAIFSVMAEYERELIRERAAVRS